MAFNVRLVKLRLFVLLVVMLHLKRSKALLSKMTSSTFVRTMSDKPDSKKDFVPSLALFTLFLGGAGTGFGVSSLCYYPIINDYRGMYNDVLAKLHRDRALHIS